MVEVVLEGVGKTYANGVVAVRDLNLHVQPGELIVLIGPSGCGKTTTLRLVAGLENPTSGRIRLGGRVVNDTPPHQRDVALVFQRPVLYPHLNVADNLAFGLAMRQARPWWRRWFHRNDRSSSSTEERKGRVLEVAGWLGLSEVLDRPPAELSGGQQQRVALGRALVRRPGVFLLDEPLSNLDAPLRLEMRRELHLLHRRLGATMFYVTHDQEEALSLGDRIVVLDHGVVQQVDHPQVVYERPANRFVASFLGWPTINTLEGMLLESEGRIHFARREAKGVDSLICPEGWRPFLGQRVILGIRPEQIHWRLASGPDGGEREGEAVMTMEVRLVEKLGASHLVTLQRGPWTVVAPASARMWQGLVERSPVCVGLRLHHAHLFEANSGRALWHGEPAG
jgi:multiple sugar transport system ATP-binding protein